MTEQIATTPQQSEPVVFTGQLLIPYRFEAGRTGTRFLKELRDNKKVMGLKCPACNRVYVPPRSTCKECFAKIDQWVEVASEGTLMTYTILRAKLDASHKELGRKLPVAYGIIKLDGADTGFVHLLGEVDLDKVKVGMRVKAVFEEERVGSIMDINYFKPIS